MNLVKHSYKDDCIFLLKDLTESLREITIEEKEELIRQGISYSEMISKEERPTKEIIEMFKDIVEHSSAKIAEYVGRVSEKIYSKNGENLVVVSLARGGTPYGILIKKYLKYKYNIDIPHYSISIIRGRGIDFNALKYILSNHQYGKIQFVDGWTGKGSIINELHSSIEKFNKKYESKIDSTLAVIADPAKLCHIYGTREDILIPTCCLNSTVSGLISRTVLNSKLIGEYDFHGAKTMEYLKNEDLSQYFIDMISGKFNREVEFLKNFEAVDLNYSEAIVNEIMSKYNVNSKNNVKLSIGETTRVLLRRKPSLILVKDKNDKDVKYILHLAQSKNIQVETCSNGSYGAIALIDEGRNHE